MGAWPIGSGGHAGVALWLARAAARGRQPERPAGADGRGGWLGRPVVGGFMKLLLHYGKRDHPLLSEEGWHYVVSSSTIPLVSDRFISPTFPVGRTRSHVTNK